MDTFIIQTELVATPEHLLNIDRISPPPYPEHPQRRMIANRLAESWLEVKETLVERRWVLAIQDYHLGARFPAPNDLKGAFFSACVNGVGTGRSRALLAAKLRPAT